eukprot:s599_g4.t1
MKCILFWENGRINVWIIQAINFSFNNATRAGSTRLGDGDGVGVATGETASMGAAVMAGKRWCWDLQVVDQSQAHTVEQRRCRKERLKEECQEMEQRQMQRKQLICRWLWCPFADVRAAPGPAAARAAAAALPRRRAAEGNTRKLEWNATGAMGQEQSLLQDVNAFRSRYKASGDPQPYTKAARAEEPSRALCGDCYAALCAGEGENSETAEVSFQVQGPATQSLPEASFAVPAPGSETFSHATEAGTDAQALWSQRDVVWSEPFAASLPVSTEEEPIQPTPPEPIQEENSDSDPEFFAEEESDTREEEIDRGADQGPM